MGLLSSKKQYESSWILADQYYISQEDLNQMRYGVVQSSTIKQNTLEIVVYLITNKIIYLDLLPETSYKPGDVLDRAALGNLWISEYHKDGKDPYHNAIEKPRA